MSGICLYKSNSMTVTVNLITNLLNNQHDLTSERLIPMIHTFEQLEMFLSKQFNSLLTCELLFFSWH